MNGNQIYTFSIYPYVFYKWFVYDFLCVGFTRLRRQEYEAFTCISIQQETIQKSNSTSGITCSS